MTDQSLTTLIQAWLIDLRIDRAQGTVDRYAAVTRRLMQWLAEQEAAAPQLDAVTPIALVGYIHTVQRSEQPSTVNTHVAALRSWGKWLNEQHHLEANPAARLKFIKQQAPLAPRSLRPNEVNALLREAQRSGRYRERNTAIIMVLVQTGIRIGECVALRWGDITFGEKSGTVLIRSGKGNKPRQVPLNASARQALADYVAPLLEIDSSLKSVARLWPMQPSQEPLWKSERGTMTLSAMERTIKNLIRSCAQRGLLSDQATAHSLRHTFATQYLANNPGDLVGLARLLGHSSLDITKIYVQPTEAEIVQRVEQLDLNAYG